MGGENPACSKSLMRQRISLALDVCVRLYDQRISLVLDICALTNDSLCGFYNLEFSYRGYMVGEAPHNRGLNSTCVLLSCGLWESTSKLVIHGAGSNSFPPLWQMWLCQPSGSNPLSLNYIAFVLELTIQDMPQKVSIILCVGFMVFHSQLQLHEKKNAAIAVFPESLAVLYKGHGEMACLAKCLL